MPGGRTNCSPNSHRKCRRNVPRIFDVCWELKSDCKSYFGFLVDKFSEAVNTEITTFSIIAWSDCRSWSQVKKICRQFFLLPLRKKKCLIAGYQNWEFLYYWFRIIWTIALHFSHQIPQYVSTRLSVGIQWIWMSGIYLFETFLCRCCPL